MKTPPCGGTNPRSAMPAVFAPGQKITVKWHETVEHPGFFRVAFSTDGKTFPADPTDPPPAVAAPVLAIIPKVTGVTAHSADITLPNMPCETCSIQVIQYMEQHAPPPYYYQCGDIAIRQGAGGAGNGGTANATGGASAAGGTGAGGSGGTMNFAGASTAGGTMNVAGASAAGATNGAGTAGTSSTTDAGSESAGDSNSGCSLSPGSHRAPSWFEWLAALGAACMLRRRRVGAI